MICLCFFQLILVRWNLTKLYRLKEIVLSRLKWKWNKYLRIKLKLLLLHRNKEIIFVMTFSSLQTQKYSTLKISWKKVLTSCNLMFRERLLKLIFNLMDLYHIYYVNHYKMNYSQFLQQWKLLLEVLDFMVEFLYFNQKYHHIWKKLI